MDDQESSAGLSDDELVARLGPFFERNPDASMGQAAGSRVIAKPWDDETIALQIREPSDALLDALTNLIFPPRFTAIWHVDTSRLEVIWGPLNQSSPFRDQAFGFTFNDRTYHCAFEPASDRLIWLAEASRPIRPPTSTGHRNLSVIDLFLHFKAEHPEEVEHDDVVSFWIDGFEEWDEEAAVEVARHLNYYMAYFEPEMPIILVHDRPAKESEKPKSRAVLTLELPESIVGRPLDPYLLGLWESSIESHDPLRRFLHLYQILEYAAFYHMQSTLSPRGTPPR